MIPCRLPPCGGCRCTLTLFKTVKKKKITDLGSHNIWVGCTRDYSSPPMGSWHVYRVNSLMLHHCHAPTMTSSYTEPPPPNMPLSRDLNALSCVKTNKMFNLRLTSGIKKKAFFCHALHALRCQVSLLSRKNKIAIALQHKSHTT